MRSVSKEHLYVVIPAYNAAATITEVVNRLKKFIYRERIIVVNDGSTDNTENVIKCLNIIALHHDKNKGKGAALKTGINEALCRGAEAILTIDADLQHKPEDVKLLMDYYRKHDVDVIIASRMNAKKNMPFHRKLSNFLTSKIVSLRIHQKIIDSQCGFRLYKRKVFETFTLTANHYDLESEILIKAGICGFRIGFVNSPAIYKTYQNSYIRMIDIFRFIRIVIKSMLWRKPE